MAFIKKIIKKKQQNNRNCELSGVTLTGILCPHGHAPGPAILFLSWGEKETCVIFHVLQLGWLLFDLVLNGG